MIINNNGIYSGLESELYQDITGEGEPTITSPPTALLPGTEALRQRLGPATPGLNRPAWLAWNC